MKRPTSTLAQKLVAPQQQLAPQQARAQSVAMPHALPQQIRYGHIQPGLPQSQRFTGAVAQQQPMSQIVPPPDFRSPYYENLGLTVPRPFSTPTQETAPAAGSRLGALLTPPIPPTPPRPPGTQGTQGTPPLVQKDYAARPNALNPNPTPQNPAPPHLPTPGYGPTPQSFALTAALAQMGQRLGTSRSAATFY